MNRKYIVAGLLVAPVLALSSLAYAAPQPSDRAWWPNHGRDVSAAYGTQPAAARHQLPMKEGGQTTCRYQGGRSMVCSTR